MAKIYTVTETSKIIRKQLKAKFPETKFSVRSNRFSGGSSIDISWADGESKDRVEEVVNFFSTQTFNGIDDSTNNKEVIWEGEAAIFPHYLNIKRETSEEFLNKILTYCAEKYRRLDFEGVYPSGGQYSRFYISEAREHDEYVEARDVAYEELNRTSDREIDWKIEELGKKDAITIEESIKLYEERDQEYLDSCEKPEEATALINSTHKELTVIAVEMEFVDCNTYLSEDGKTVTHFTYGEVENIPRNEDRAIKPMLRVEKDSANWQMSIQEWNLLTNSKVISLNKRKQLKVDAVSDYLTQEFAKWVTAQAKADPLKVRDYSYWLKIFASEETLKAAYKIKVQEQIDSNLVDNIVRYKEWVQALKASEQQIS